MKMKAFFSVCVLFLTLLGSANFSMAQAPAKLAAPSETMLHKPSALIVNIVVGEDAGAVTDIETISTKLKTYFAITRAYDARSRSAKEELMTATDSYTNRIVYTVSMVNGAPSIYLGVESYDLSGSGPVMKNYYGATGLSLEELLSKIDADLAP